jgi:Alginate lyase
VNAAEILRYTWQGWATSNITQFSNMIQTLFVPAAYVQGLAVYPFSGNWGTTAEKAIIAYGVFLDDTTLYNDAVSMYTTGGRDDVATCGKLPFMIPSATGQYVESGRDQGHTQLSLGNMAELSQVALSQGDDSIFSYLSNRLRDSYEYTSEYQTTNNTLPYNSSVSCCYCPETFGTWIYLSSAQRYQYRPIHEISYAYFVSLKGGSMPFTKDLLEIVGIESTNPVNADNDNAEWGSLRFRISASL